MTELPAGPTTAAMSSPRAPHRGPLEGIVVIDLSRVLAGPYCAQLLADMGAQVIKIESLDGDENRRWPPLAADDVSSNYGSVNRGKLGMALNLKSPCAAEVVRRLVLRADVVLHNYLPDTAARLGLDDERIRGLNPRAVVCSLSGYGANGPLRNKPGYDLMMQAFSGAMGLTGYEGGDPVRVGVSFIDMAAGITTYAAVVTALMARERTGIGGTARTSLLETGVSILGYHAVSWLQAGIVPRKEGSHAGNLAPYQPFLCTDGYVVAGATNDRVFATLCAILGCGELVADPRFLTNVLRVRNRGALNDVLNPIFAQQAVAHWQALLDANGIPNAPVHTLDQVLTHPQVLANDMVVEATNAQGNAVKLVGLPFKLSAAAGPSPGAAPSLGADTTTILADLLGFSGDEIVRLRDGGAIGVG